jgi:hypothetical protein
MSFSCASSAVEILSKINVTNQACGICNAVQSDIAECTHCKFILCLDCHLMNLDATECVACLCPIAKSIKEEDAKNGSDDEILSLSSDDFSLGENESDENENVDQLNQEIEKFSEKLLADDNDFYTTHFSKRTNSPMYTHSNVPLFYSNSSYPSSYSKYTNINNAVSAIPLLDLNGKPYQNRNKQSDKLKVDTSNVVVQNYDWFQPLTPYEPVFYDPTDDIIVATEKIKLPNLGNSCYINSVMQIMLHCDYFWQAILSTFDRVSLLRRLREQYCKFAQIHIYEQCDAVLFLNWLLDKMESHNVQWLHTCTVKYVCQTDGCGNSSKENEKKSIWIVYPCSKGSEPQYDENGVVYLHDLIQCVGQQQTQTIEKRCSKCSPSSNVNFERYEGSFVSQENEHLFFNLQHFEDQSIYIHEHLELSMSFVDDKSKRNVIVEYELAGVIMHKGSQQFGHYTCYMKDSDGWCCYNDDSDIIRSECSINDILGYHYASKRNIKFPLLWYRRLDDEFVNENANEA